MEKRKRQRRKHAGVRLYRRGRVWWAWGYDAAGERWSESTRQRDEHAAAQVALRLERERASATDAARPLALEKAFAELVMHLRTRKRSETTLSIYESKAGHLVRLLGARCDVSRLTQADFLAYMERRANERADERDPGPSLHTIRFELRVLLQAIRYCARKGLCTPRVPVADLMPKELSQTQVYHPRERWLTRDEYARLLLQLAPERRDYVVALCNTGMRLGELYRLEAHHVHATARELDVPGQKTRRARRRIPLTDDALDVLDRRAKARKSGPLFDPWGKLHRDVRAACKRAGIEAASPNDFRRTFASWLAQSDAPMLTVSRLLGHASTKMVEQVYAQLDRDSLRNAVEKLNAPRRAQKRARKA